MQINVVVADHHPIVVVGVGMILGQQDDIKVFGTANDSSGVVEILSSVSCDVLVTDDTLPCGDLAAESRYLALLADRFPDVKIVVFSMTQASELVRTWTHTGMYSFVPKSADTAELVSAVRNAFARSVPSPNGMAFT